VRGTVNLLRGELRTSSARVWIGKLESSIYRMFIVPLVALLPAIFAYGIALLIGDLRYRFYKEYREEIESTLAHVFGNRLSPEGRSRAARDWYRLRSCETVDVMRLVGNGNALSRLVHVRGLEHIENALAEGKGAFLCSAHFGSYRCCFSLLGSLGFPVTLITNWSYDDDHLSPIDRLFYRLLQDRPVVHHLRRPNIVRRQGRIGVAVQAAILLRRNELIANMLDHSDYGDPVAPPDSAGHISVDFLDGKATLLPGAISIAQLTGAKVLVILLRRSHDWRHQVLEIFPPIPVQGDALEAFRKCLAILENAIYQNPSHWIKWNYTAMSQLRMMPVSHARFQSYKQQLAQGPT